jgi:hypothetical protein
MITPDKIDRDPAQDGEIAGGVLVAHAAVVLPEGDVEDPVQRILDSLVLADGPTEHNRIVTTAR